MLGETLPPIWTERETSNKMMFALVQNIGRNVDGTRSPLESNDTFCYNIELSNMLVLILAPQIMDSERVVLLVL